MIDGTYHLFVTEMRYGCHLDAWQHDSSVVHATSSTPAGPYAKQEVVLLPEAHNPATVQLPDGRLAIFHIGAGDNSSFANCTGLGVASPPRPARSSSSNSGGVVHVAPGPAGPWTPLPLGLGCNNPAPMVHPNKTLYLICNGGGFTLYRSESIDAARWTAVTRLPPSPRGAGIFEDPFLYLDGRGHFHVLAHAWNHSDNNAISGHYYSMDGLSWGVQTQQPFGNTAQLTDGSVLHMKTRERPKLLFNTAGQPSHLFSGVNTNAYCQPPVPASRCKVEPGYDWDYTFVQPIATK